MKNARNTKYFSFRKFIQYLVYIFFKLDEIPKVEISLGEDFCVLDNTYQCTLSVKHCHFGIKKNNMNIFKTYSHHC